MYETIQKTIVAWAFNHYIACYYFDNVNVNQLKVAFEKGEIELENLPIKQDALKHFDLPMEVISGVVGRLSVKVPLLTLLTDPWTIKISDLILIVKPTNSKGGQKDENPSSQEEQEQLKKTTSSINNKNLDQHDSTDHHNSEELINEKLNTAAFTMGMGIDLDEKQQSKIIDYLNESNFDENSLQSGLFDGQQSSNNNESLDESNIIVNNSEETKLAEFYSSFTETVSAMVKDIYKNIRLEIDSSTILFEKSEHGLIKLSLDHLLLHRPRSHRNLIVDNLTLFLNDTGIGLFKTQQQTDLVRLHVDQCNIDIFDESSNKMQLAVLQTHETNQDQAKGKDQAETNKSSSTCSEIRCDGKLKNVTIDLYNSPDDGKSAPLDGKSKSSSRGLGGNLTGELIVDDGSPNSLLLLSNYKLKQTILACDTIRTELKFSKNIETDTLIITEKNLQMKFDMIGMQYKHSQKMYDLATKRLKDLLRFVVELYNRPSRKGNKSSKRVNGRTNTKSKDQKSNSNKLFVVNIVDGLVYVIDDSTSCAIPTLELSLDDCRILQFSGKHQQNGFVFAKIGCNHFNRVTSSWETLLHPWSFNLSWDFKSGIGSLKHISNFHQQRLISLTSDEVADFVLTPSFIDLCNIALKKMVIDFIKPSHWSLLRNPIQSRKNPCTDFNSIFILNNESGHRLFFAPMEQNSDIFEIQDSSNSLIVSGGLGGDSINNTILRKSSSHCKADGSISGDSSELITARWMSVEAGESKSFEYETMPIYRRYVQDRQLQSRVLMVRIEGWKTLLPIVIDKTGTFHREAMSDRVCNEDTHIAITIQVDEKSARKIITIRSPINLVNSLDTTLEVHFAEAKQAFYIKPDHHLAVPLPYLYNTMRVRPCNVGVTVSEQSMTWDDIRYMDEIPSRIFICKPVSVTNHASYSNSKPYRICVSVQRDGQTNDVLSKGNYSSDELLDLQQAPIFTIQFLAPLTIVNLLPNQISYSIGDMCGSLPAATQRKLNQVDTGRPNDLFFTMDRFPKSKPVSIDPGATGNFYQTIELLDNRNRSLFLKAKIILGSTGEKPAIEVVIYAEFWFLNKTGLPLVFKQEGATLDAAGQFVEHEDTCKDILLFSFYDTELEPPWLCSMRLGNSKGLSSWCEGFKLEKGSGERRINYISNAKKLERKYSKHLIDISIRKGYGRYSETIIVTYNLRYGFDPTTKTPKKATVESPHNYKLTSYNHNTNLAERIAGQAVNLFNNNYQKSPIDVNMVLPGFKMALMGKMGEKLIDASVKDMVVNCTTKAKEQVIDCSVQEVRIDNTLPDCECSIMLDRACPSDGHPSGGSNNKQVSLKPAIRLIMDRVLGSSFGATLFRQVQLTTCELMLNIEEKLFLKLVELMSFTYNRKTRKQNEWPQELDKNLDPEEDRRSKYYFDLLRIDLSSLQLSVYTSADIPESLQKLKSYLGLKFFNFEDAKLQLSPYFKMNVSRTFKGVFESVTRFYKKQILDQAPRIVGQQIQNYLRFHLSDLLSTLYDEVYNKLMIL